MTKLIVALDTADPNRAANLVQQLDGLDLMFKVGREFIEANGAGIQLKLGLTGPRIMHDAKLYDIGNTVSGAAKAIAERINPALLTMPLLGNDLRGFAAVRKAIADSGSLMRILGITVLTSMGDADLSAMLGRHVTVRDEVERLLHLAGSVQVDGIVCSSHEISMARRILGPQALIVVPGIRPVWADNPGDQVRVATPAQARASGATHIVVGRPVTGAASPAKAAQRILNELN